MIQILLNSIALEPNRWTSDKIAYFNLGQLIAHIAGAGFHFIELWQFHISRVTESKIKEYHRIAEAHNLSFPVIGMYPALHFRDLRRQQELDSIERLMKYAKLLGTDILKTFVGTVGSEQITDSEYERSVEFMLKILELADSYNLTIAGETHQNTLFDTMESCQKTMAAINSENLKVCFQPLDFDNTEKAISDYQSLADNIIHIHYQGQKNGKYALLADSDLDYTKLTTAVIERGFSGKICIEFVKDCVVKEPKFFDVHKVLENAILDRDFIVKALEKDSRIGLAY